MDKYNKCQEPFSLVLHQCRGREYFRAVLPLSILESRSVGIIPTLTTLLPFSLDLRFNMRCIHSQVHLTVKPKTRTSMTSKKV